MIFYFIKNLMSICSICLDDNYKKEYYVTTCNHVFHKSCLLKINHNKKTINKNDDFKFIYINCPLCRNELSIPMIFHNSYCCYILNNKLFNIITNIYSKIKKSNLNPYYTFISGNAADILYNIIRSNTIDNNQLNDLLKSIDIYYIDYDNLYDIDLNSDYYATKLHYEFNYFNFNIKNIKKENNYKIIIVNSFNLLFKKINIKSFILNNLENAKTHSNKIAFVINDNYIDFYTHIDYYKNEFIE